MIKADALTKHFGPIRAVNGVTFAVEKGEVLGFLGPNGAGKSTTMKTLCGFLSPTSGSASICGHDIVREPMAAKSRLGYLPEGAPAYADMTPRAYLGFISSIRGLSGAQRGERFDKVVEQTNLQGVLDQPIDTLSKGYKRRVGLAQALIHDPDVLILDEPTDGLDPNQKHEVRSLIREMAPNKAIIISTHILEEVHAVCSRAIIIAAGKILADGTPAELEARSRRHNAVAIELDQAAAEKVTGELKKLAEVADVEAAGEGRLLVLPKDGEAIVEKIAATARTKKWPVNQIYIERGHLDDVFRDITSKAA